MATPTNAPLTSEIWHLSIDDLLEPMSEPPRLGGQGPFVINLSASSAPVSQPAKSLAPPGGTCVYQIQRTEDRRPRYRLRLGPFLTEDQADAVLAVVREVYPGALTATAESDDLRAIASLRPKSESAPAAAVPIPAVAKPAMAVQAPLPQASPIAVRAATAAAAPSSAEPTAPAVARLLAAPVAPAVARLPAAPVTPAAARPPAAPVASAAARLPAAPMAPAASPSSAAPVAPVLRPNTSQLAPRAASRLQPLPQRASIPVLSDSVEVPRRPASIPPASPPAATRAPTTLAAPAARPSPIPRSLPDIESTQTLRALSASELQNSATRWYVIQLSLSEQRFDPDSLPNLDIFNEYRLYSVAGLDQGRIVHALRLGFFAEEGAAAMVARYLAGFYEKPTIKRVSVAERERFGDQRVEARKDIGATGRHAVIEITGERHIRDKKLRIATVTPLAPPAAAQSMVTPPRAGK
jgi:hypothetical protein